MSDRTSIVDSIERYFELRSHSDKKFRKKLKRFREWKGERMLASYAPMIATSAQRELLAYCITEIFGGVDLSGLENAKSVLGLVERFFTGTEMLTLGLEFNALTGEIDEALASTLFEDMQVESIDDAALVEACRRADVLDRIGTQIVLFQASSSDLNATTRDRAIVRAVKLAGIPARVVGFGDMHALVAHGLKYAGNVEDVERFFSQLVEHERKVLDNIRRGVTPVFFEVTRSSVGV